MSSCAPPRNRARDVAAGAALLTLVSGLTLPVATAAPDRVVRLAPDSGSVVRAAEVALRGGTSRLRTSAYSMVGATWRGPAPTIVVRTGPGEGWQELERLEDLPTRGGPEGEDAPSATDLLWTGPRAGIDVRVSGTGHQDLELVLIDPGELSTDREVTATPRPARVAATTAPRPALRDRGDWGADPDWRNGRARYIDRLKQVHVHHTATGNDYRRADVPAILRGMYRYHTQTLGWFDIGYNFLVDRFGRAWVGRSGGPNRLVQGAHTLGFNNTSVGIALLGNLDRRQASTRAVRTLVRLSAWKLDKHDRDAVGRVRVTSTGSDRYPEGRRVRLPVIDGHRDTNHTACPGQRLYDRLPAIRRRTQKRIDTFS